MSQIWRPVFMPRISRVVRRGAKNRFRSRGPTFVGICSQLHGLICLSAPYLHRLSTMWAQSFAAHLSFCIHHRSHERSPISASSSIWLISHCILEGVSRSLAPLIPKGARKVCTLCFPLPYQFVESIRKYEHLDAINSRIRLARQSASDKKHRKLMTLNSSWIGPTLPGALKSRAVRFNSYITIHFVSSDFQVLHDCRSVKKLTLNLRACVTLRTSTTPQSCCK